MGLNTINENRVALVRSYITEKGIKKSRIVHQTGLHFYVVEDILNYLEGLNQIENKEGKWRLKK